MVGAKYFLFLVLVFEVMGTLPIASYSPEQFRSGKIIRLSQESYILPILEHCLLEFHYSLLRPLPLPTQCLDPATN